MQTFTATNAKQNFGELLEAVNTEDVMIVKNGRPFAYVVSAKRKSPISLTEAKRKIIASYFAGEINRTRAMKLGEYDWYRDLLEDARLLSVPLPILPKELRDEMVNDAMALLGPVSND